MSVLTKLIEQAKNPRGFVGSSMLCIMNAAHTNMTKWAFSKVNISKHARMLDIGCGGGKAIHTLSKMNSNGKIYGIDYSKQAVENSIKLNKKDVDSGKVFIKQASVSAMPFSNDFFNIITAFQTHYFWPDLENDVKEVFRILKPNGYFLIVAELYKINYHMTKFKTKTDIEKLLKETGYNNVIFHEYRGSICVVARK
ncbi:class I SAM-dependent methyltransferase [Bacillus cytotoxicus]|uniref:Class I SAM-dependent methyltransferase n=1 Tax=Bacillus cytotoxicus TaxID=580165 RepID=A0ACC6A7N5_9BACI|nr:class I SAM-dependent methyltransferase [Bacillus cytotoxicus]